MTREERNQLNYLRRKEAVCPLGKDELYELAELERKEDYEC